LTRKEENFRTVFGTHCGGQLSKRKDILIKYNVSRDVDMTRRCVEALIAFMKVTVAKDNTTGRTKLKFSGIIRTEVGPTGTIKNPKI
jgi:hypothetical protein